MKDIKNDYSQAKTFLAVSVHKDENDDKTVFIDRSARSKKTFRKILSVLNDA